MEYRDQLDVPPKQSMMVGYNRNNGQECFIVLDREPPHSQDDFDNLCTWTLQMIGDIDPDQFEFHSLMVITKKGCSVLLTATLLRVYIEENIDMSDL